MPTAGRLSWDERLDEIQRRLGEQIGSPAQVGLDAPYYGRSDIEQILLEVSNAALRVISIEELGNTTAIVSDIGTSPIEIEEEAIRLVSATVDSFPAVEVEPSRYFLASDTRSLLFSIMANAGTRVIRHNGTNGNFALMVERSLFVWQSTIDILPPAYDEKTIAESVAILSLADNVEF